jgi:uncharacterized integral membrane protein (TIGR00698 family)
MLNLQHFTRAKDYIPGFLAVLFIAVFSWYISKFHEAFDALVISIVIGMLLGNIIGDRDYFEKGIDGAIKVFLPAGIALYGTQLVFNDLKLGFILIIFLVFISMFGLTLLISKSFNINRRIGLLLASGLSVCGASAIAVISPLIDARREDTSISILSVMLLGLTGMLFYPILYDVFLLTKDEIVFLTGATLPMLGQVKVSAGSISPEILSAAVKIKLIRISFLVFLVTTAIFLSGKEEKKVKVPWFIVVFILLAVFVNSTKMLEPVLGYFKAASSLFLSANLAAIGFSVDFSAVIEEGISPFTTIFLSWGIIILIIYIIMSLV